MTIVFRTALDRRGSGGQGESPLQDVGEREVARVALSNRRALATGIVRGVVVWLEVLDLNENQLSGEIPRELGNLTNLKVLRLDGSQLSGCVPRGLKDRLDMDRSDLGGLPFC